MKKAICLILTFVMILSTMPCIADGNEKETVYIETIEDLLALDGQENKRLELNADIDLSGVEWSALRLTNCEFYGNGYTLHGLTVTEDIGVKWGNLWEIGLMSGEENRLYDLNLSEINIDIEFTGKEYWYRIAPLGMVDEAVNCSVKGSINIAEGVKENYFTDVYGICNGTGCIAELDINLENVTNCVTVYGINGYDMIAKNCIFKGNITGNTKERIEICGISDGYNCYMESDIRLTAKEDEIILAAGIVGGRGCYFKGDIELNGKKSSATGIDYSENCYVLGDITAYEVCGIIDSKGSCAEGNLTGDGYARGIQESENCYLIGNSISEGVSYGIENSTECYVKGFVKGYTAYGITNSTLCSLEGGVLGGRQAFGIEKSDECYLEGDITASTDDARVQLQGISEGDKNYLKGNIRGWSPSSVTCYGIRIGEENYLEGNIEAVAESEYAYGYGIQNSDNSTLTGDIYVEGNGNGTYFYGISDSAFSHLEGNLTVVNGIAYGIGQASSYSCMKGDVKSVNARRAEGTAALASFYGTATAIYKGKSLSCVAGEEAVLYECGRVRRFENEYSNRYNWPDCEECLDEEGNHLYCDALIIVVGGRSIIGGGSIENAPALPEPPKEPEEKKHNYALLLWDNTLNKPVKNAQVTIDGKSFTSDEEGIVKVTDGSVRIETMMVKSDTGIDMVLTDYMALPDTINTVRLRTLSIECEDFFTGVSQSDVLTGPDVMIMDKTFPLFSEKINVDMSLFENVGISVGYNSDTETYEVIIGGKEGLVPQSEEIQDATAESWKELIKSFKDLYASAKGGTFNPTDLARAKKICSPKKKGFIFDADTVFGGYLEIKPDKEGKFSITNCGLVYVLEGSAEFDCPFPPAPYVYLAMELEGEIESKLGVKVTNWSLYNPEFEGYGEVEYEIPLSVGIGLGLRSSTSVEGGIQGALGGSVTMPMKDMQTNAEVYITAGGYFAIQVLAFEFEKAVNFYKKQLYPEAESAQLMGIESYDDFELIKRDYDEMELFEGKNEGISVYPYSRVSSVQLSDGRILLVWLDDNSERSLINKTSLYYSVIENGSMSEPVQIHDDKTADFDFYLSGDGDRAGIVWQNVNLELSDTDTVDTMAENIDLYYSEFDGEEWSEPVQLTKNNTDYEYSPKLNYGYPSHIVWTENDKNSLIPGVGTTGESVFAVAVKDGEATEEKLKYDKLPLIYETAVDINGLVACVADKDGDFTNGNTGILYWNGKKIIDRDTVISNLDCEGDFCFIENETFKTVNYAGEIADIIKIGDADAAVYDMGSFYFVKDNAVYMVNNEMGTVKVSDFDGVIRSWDVFTDLNGETSIAAIIGDIKTEGDSLDNTAKLICKKTALMEDIEVAALYTDMDNEKCTTNIIVVNNTAVCLSSPNVKIEGEECGIIYEGTGECSIPVGSEGIVKVEYALPEDFEKQGITATLTNGREEVNDGNNSAYEVIGSGDLAVSISQKDTSETGIVVLKVKNNGYEEMSGVLTLTGEGGEVFLREEITVSGREEKSYEYILEEKYYNFEKDDESFAVTIAVETDGDASLADNTDTCRISSKKVNCIRFDKSILKMDKDESIKPAISTYPKVEEGIKLYAFSSDEKVVSVADDGTMTATGDGEAVVTYCSPYADNTVRLTVRVGDGGDCRIVSAEYYEYTENEETCAWVSAEVDISECYYDDDTQVYVALYDEDGNFVSGEIYGVEDNTISYYYDVYGNIPVEIKVFLWNVLTPICENAEAEITKIVDE